MVDVMASRKTADTRSSAVTSSDLNTLSQATVLDSFNEDAWTPPISLPKAGPLDMFRLKLIDHAPQVLATTGPGWTSRGKAAAIARAISRADPAVTLRTYRGRNLPRKTAGRYETFIQPAPDGHRWHIAARHNPDATWPTRQQTGGSKNATAVRQE